VVGLLSSRPRWSGNRAPTGAFAVDGVERVTRNTIRGGEYRPFEAHRHATARRARHHQRRIEVDSELRAVLGDLLNQRWRRLQSTRHLRRRFPDLSGMWLCHESIYQAIYQPGSLLMRPSHPDASFPATHRARHPCGRISAPERGGHGSNKPHAHDPPQTLSPGRPLGIGNAISPSAKINNRDRNTRRAAHAFRRTLPDTAAIPAAAQVSSVSGLNSWAGSSSPVMRPCSRL
jgi:hypothetical protein